MVWEMQKMLMNQRKMHTIKMQPKMQRGKMLPRILHLLTRLSIVRTAATVKTAIKKFKREQGVLMRGRGIKISRPLINYPVRD